MHRVIRVSLRLHHEMGRRLGGVNNVRFCSIGFSCASGSDFRRRCISIPRRNNNGLVPRNVKGPKSICAISGSGANVVNYCVLRARVVPNGKGLAYANVKSKGRPGRTAGATFGCLGTGKGHVSNRVDAAAGSCVVGCRSVRNVKVAKGLTLPALVTVYSTTLDGAPLGDLTVLNRVDVKNALVGISRLTDALRMYLSDKTGGILLPVASTKSLKAMPSSLIKTFDLVFCSSTRRTMFGTLNIRWKLDARRVKVIHWGRRTYKRSEFLEIYSN